MPRAVVLPSRLRAFHENAEVGAEAYYSSRDGAEVPLAADTYAERLVKYIPGEAVGFFLLISATDGISDTALAIFAAIGLVGAILWALNRNMLVKEGVRQPPLMVIIFTGAAFSAWALGTSIAVQELLGIGQQLAALIMLSVAFLLPATDDHASRMLGTRPLRKNAQ